MDALVALLWEYEGIMLPMMMNREGLEQIKNFEVRDDDIWLCTYPKSGTHWLMQIIQLLRFDGDYEKVFQAGWKDCKPVEFALPTPDGSVNYAYKYYEQLPSPRLVVTHLPFKLLPRQVFEKKAKVIYVARNPKDTAVSMYHFSKPGVEAQNVKLEWDPFIQMFMSDKATCGPWAAHVLPFWNRRNEDNVLFLKYEDIKTNTMENIRKVAIFAGLSTSEIVLQKTVENSSIKRTKAVMDNEDNKAEVAAEVSVGAFVRKGIVGDWMSYFTVSQSRAFDEILDNYLKESGLVMAFE